MSLKVSPSRPLWPMVGPSALTFVSEVVALIARSTVHRAAISGSNGKSRRNMTETADPLENQSRGHPHYAVLTGGGLDGAMTQREQADQAIQGQNRKA